MVLRHAHPTVKTKAFGRLLVYQSGAAHFGSVYYAVCTLLCWGPALLLLLLTRIRVEYPYLLLIFFAAGLLTCAKLFITHRTNQNATRR